MEILDKGVSGQSMKVCKKTQKWKKFNLKVCVSQLLKEMQLSWFLHSRL